MIYGHGDDRYQYDIDFKANFSSNVWYQKTSKELLQYLQKQLSEITNYPDPNADELVEKIASHHQLKTENILVTNGATEAFYIISNLFFGKKASIGIPTFSEYEDACERHKMQITYYNRQDVVFNDFKEDLAFICNPNNPDGFSNSLPEIRKLVIEFPKTTFVIDEAYIDFTFQVGSCVSLLDEFDNIIIIKSLTKLFSIPGLRLGYILCNAVSRKKLQQYKMPWNVNTLAIEAGKYIFENYERIFPDMAVLLTYCKSLQKEIDALDGFRVIPSQTNYFLVKLNMPDASKLKDYLANTHQLLIRDASNFKGLNQHYIRIASQDPQKNELLINALKAWSVYQ